MNDPVENPRIARNVLTNAALIRLTDWARQNVESCQTLSNKTLATMAGETLNLHLTATNIASALEAVNITKIKPKAPPTLEERIAELESTVANHAVHLNALHANVNQLIRLVDDLERAKSPGWNKARPGIAEQLKLDQAQYTPPEPTQIQIIATDGPITVTPPDLDTAVAQVKAEREREYNADDSLAPLTPIHGMTSLFDEVDDHFEGPEYKALFNLEITAENPQGIASFIGFEKR